MAQRRNYLLGYGERLVEDIPAPRARRTKAHPYSFGQALENVSPLLAQTIEQLNILPNEACPGDEAVALVSLHPAYIAKSFYPLELFNTIGVRAVGSRPRDIKPKKWQEGEHPESALTAEFFVAGERRRFRDWARSLQVWTEESPGANDLRKIEDIRPVVGQIHRISSIAEVPLLEVVLHASGLSESFYILKGFREYMRSLDIDIDLKRRIHAGGLCFLPVRAPVDSLEEVKKFSFLRTVREMPTLRQFEPILRSIPERKGFSCNLPRKGPLDPSIQVATFDGGIPSNIDLKKWTREFTPGNVKAAVSEFQEHGLAVTSALLFGPLRDGEDAATPYARVDHYRVLDKDTGNDPQGEYYDVLLRIKSILEEKHYDFVNISVGPDSPIEDGDVHSWTAVLDEKLTSGKTLTSIPVGNNGEGDSLLGLNRIQTPSDCVNALSIGACDSYRGAWKRASYSCIGPGRSPGRTKPEAVAFGGTPNNPYHVLSSKPYLSSPRMGTSLAAPTALRSAIAVRAHLGPVVSTLALKALLIQRCESVEHDRLEAGWGRIPISVEDIITCEEGEAHVIYQGVLDPAQWVRARVPLPSGTMQGLVYIGATICVATPTDPQDPFNYTRSGLDVIFRPHSKRFPKKGGGLYAAPKTFFRRADGYVPESDLRSAFKWDTTMSAFHGFKATSLSEPVFDIHYNARLSGHRTLTAKSIPYALVVTVRSHHLPDLYDRVVQRYRTYLEILRPVIQIPVRTSRSPSSIV